MYIKAPFTLPIYCAVCGGPVTLQMAAKPLLPPHDRQAWTCPYCQKKHQAPFPYEIVWVAKGHRPDPVT